ncbi:hypothetical protein LXL04_002973 [Taraxacum kok-saghyz]
MRQTALNSSSNSLCCCICTYYCDQEEEEDKSDSKQLSKSNSKLDVLISRPIQEAYAQCSFKVKFEESPSTEDGVKNPWFEGAKAKRRERGGVAAEERRGEKDRVLWVLWCFPHGVCSLDLSPNLVHYQIQVLEVMFALERINKLGKLEPWAPRRPQKGRGEGEGELVYLENTDFMGRADPYDPSNFLFLYTIISFCVDFLTRKLTVVTYPFPLSDHKSTSIGDLIHVDVWVLPELLLVKAKIDKSIKVFKSDNGTDFVNRTFSEFCCTNGIINQTTCVYTPQQNGITGRKHRDLLNVSRSILFQSGIPFRN